MQSTEFECAEILSDSSRDGCLEVKKEKKEGKRKFEHFYAPAMPTPVKSEHWSISVSCEKRTSVRGIFPLTITLKSRKDLVFKGLHLVANVGGIL